MKILKFHYIKKPFTKKKREALSKNEYRILKNDFDGFIGVFLEKNEEENRELLEDAYSLRTRAIVLIVLVFLTLLIFLISKAYPEVLSKYILGLFYTIILVLIGVIITYFLSYFLTKKELINYRNKFKNYYTYQYKLLEKTNSYEGYLKKIEIKNKLF